MAVREESPYGPDDALGIQPDLRVKLLRRTVINEPVGYPEQEVPDACEAFHCEELRDCTAKAAGDRIVFDGDNARDPDGYRTKQFAIEWFDETHIHHLRRNPLLF